MTDVVTATGETVESASAWITATDIDEAVNSMKRDLSLRALKRRLLHEELDGATALEVSTAILALQQEAVSAGA